MMREVYAESSMIDPGHRWAIRADADVASAWRAALAAAGEADRIVAFGSFLTVAAVLAAVR